MKGGSAILLLLGVILSCGCGSEAELPHGSGLVEATQTIVSAETSGRLEQLRFDAADKISRGDTIGLIDTTILALRIRQVEAAREAAATKLRLAGIDIEQSKQNRELARKEYERVADLLPSGSANQQQFDQAQNRFELGKLMVERSQAAMAAAAADLNRVEAERDLLRRQLSDCLPTAPAAGVVTERFVEVGELVLPGKALLEIAQLDTVSVKIYLPPQDLTKFELGAPAEVDPEDGRSAPIMGRVSWIASEAEFTPKNVQTKEARADLVYAVKIRIPNPDQSLKVGMPVSVRIP
jgi:HlyD family secretion protein